MSKEQKSTNKQSTRRKTQNKKKTITINPLLIIIILILIIVLASVIILKKDNKKEKTNQIENNQTEQEIEQEMPEYSTIDMNNTENAKINGGIKENISTKLAEEKTYKGMKVKNIKLIAEGGITRLTATVENTTTENYEGGGITIIFIKEDGTEYARLEGVLPAIDSGKTNELDAGTTADIANAYDFRIE